MQIVFDFPSVFEVLEHHATSLIRNDMVKVEDRRVSLSMFIDSRQR